MLKETQNPSLQEQTTDTEIELVERNLELGSLSEQLNLALNEVVLRQDIPPHLRNLRGGGANSSDICCGILCGSPLLASWVYNFYSMIKNIHNPTEPTSYKVFEWALVIGTIPTICLFLSLIGSRDKNAQGIIAGVLSASILGNLVYAILNLVEQVGHVNWKQIDQETQPYN